MYQVLVLALAASLVVPAYAADMLVKTNATLPQWSAKAAYRPGTVTAPASRSVAIDRGALVMTAPPGDSAERQQELYAPIAEHLSKILGQPVVFKAAHNWLAYSKEMTAGAYDLVFDDSHFNAWRAERIQHSSLVRLSDNVAFALVANARDGKVRNIGDVSGRRVCAVAGPNLATLAVLAQFSNPARQPVLVESADWAGVQQNFAAGQCVGAILPVSGANKVKGNARVLYQSPEFPSPALSAGPRVNDAMQTKIVHALTEDANGKQAARKLRDSYGVAGLVAVRGQEHAGLSALLKDSLYYR